ncbi:AraJ Arabinose efflux permease [Burkholderiaceae bacterium]|jgi:predicted MFS family arabinose efflux permease
MTSQPLPNTSTSTTPVIILLALAAFASSSAFRICDPLLPVLASEFNVRTAQASSAVTYFSIAYGVMQFFYGPVGDRYGKFFVLSLATLGCAMGSLLVAFAPTLGVLELGRFISGATAAGIIPLSMAWIGDHVPYEQRQATLARYLLGSISGIAIGQLLGGVFADTVGWRWAFVFLAMIYLVVGSLLISRRRHVVEVPASGGIRLLDPVREVWAQPWARIVLVVVCLEGAFVFGPLAFVPAYLHERHEIAVAWAGGISGLFAAGALIYAFYAKYFVRRFGEYRLAVAGGCMMAFAFAVYWFSSVWYWGVLASLLSGLGYYLLHAVLQTHATQMAPAIRGTAVALFASFLFFGQSVGVILASVAVDHLDLAAVFPIGIFGLPILAIVFAWRLQKRQAAQASA